MPRPGCPWWFRAAPRAGEERSDCKTQPANPDSGQNKLGREADVSDSGRREEENPHGGEQAKFLW